jgi:ribosomal protein S18 acetylase RimI-like enzyme
VTAPVRLAAPADAGDVARLILAFRDWLGDELPTAESVAASVAQLLADAGTEFLLASAGADEPPCGVCQLRFRHSVWTATPDCWLEDLYVEDAGRGRGVGRALVLAAIERARARGARRIELDTNHDNAPAIALYESCGFSTRSKAHAHLQGLDIFMGRRV